MNSKNGIEVVRAGQTEPLKLPPGVTEAEGPSGTEKALHFGKEAYLELPNVPEIDADKPFTIAAWVRIPKAGENYVIASQFDTSPKKDGEPEKRWGWTFEVNAFNAAPPVPSIRLQGKNEKYISAYWRDEAV